jgi:hypothetical protein
MPHKRNHHKASHRVTQLSPHAAQKSIVLHKMQRRAASWLSNTATVNCPALKHVLKCYKSLHQLDVVQTFGCDLDGINAPSQWQGAMPQLPQYASTTLFTDTDNVTHKCGWVYAIIGTHSRRAVYTGWADLIPTSQHSSLCERFWKHYMTLDKDKNEEKLHQALQTHGPDKFIIVGLMRAVKQEKYEVPPGGIPIQRHAEQLCISHLDSINAGMNKIRAVRHTTHADNSVQQRMFQHAEDMIDRTATQLLISSWNNNNEQLTESDFSGYSTSKLITHYDNLSQTAPAHSSSDRLKQLVHAVIQLRIPTFDTPQPEPTRLTVVLPYSTQMFEKSPIKTILHSQSLRSYAPSDSSLRTANFSLWHKYSQPQKQQFMNAKEADTAESECICQSTEMHQYIDEHHGHVLTAQLSVLERYPELQDTLNRGTKYKARYAFSAMDWPHIGQCIADLTVSQAMRLDGLPKHAYSPWTAAFLAAFKTQTHHMPTDESMLSDSSKSSKQRLHRATHARDIIESKALQQFHSLSKHFMFSTVDKAAGSFAIMCTTWSKQRLHSILTSDAYVKVQSVTAVQIGHRIATKCQQLHIPLLKCKTQLHNGKVVYQEPSISLPRMYLILKAHKTPVAARPICSTSGTQIANIAKSIVPAINLCIETYVDIWCKVAEYLTFSTTASWILKQSSEVITRLTTVLQEPACHGSPIAVYDFSNMFTEFVQHDMKRQVRAFLNMVFDYKSGLRILATTDLLGAYSPFKSYAETMHSIKTKFSRQYKGISKVLNTYWSTADADAQCAEGIIRHDADSLTHICEYLLDNAYIQYDETIYRQVKGIPMGLPTSPQLAHMYTGMYELTALIKLSTSLQTGHAIVDNRMMVQSMWNWSRMIDDIATYGWQHVPEVTRILTEFVYPTKVRDADGSEVCNPMHLNLEREGKQVHYLDLDITVTNNGLFHTKVYNKRDHLQALHDYRNFAHINSLISNAAKYGVYTSALHRFAKLSSTPDGFSASAINLLRKMVQHGYNYQRLHNQLYNFRTSYQWIQLQVFHMRRAESIKRIWRRMMRTVNRDRRNLKRLANTLKK